MQQTGSVVALKRCMAMDTGDLQYTYYSLPTDPLSTTHYQISTHSLYCYADMTF